LEFSSVQFDDSCVEAVLENRVLDVLKRYRHSLLTGEISTKHEVPEVLGETELVTSRAFSPAISVGT